MKKNKLKYFKKILTEQLDQLQDENSQKRVISLAPGIYFR